MKTFLLSIFFFSLHIFSLSSIISLTYASIYRCEDSSGITVITDSPVQLDKCTMVFEDSALDGQALRSQRTSNARQPTTLGDPTQMSEQLGINDENGEYSFIDEESRHSEKEPADVVVIPVRSYGGSLLVKVQLNTTRNAQLILDTGATMTVLSNEVALDLGLIASTTTELTTVNTAGGPIQVNVTKIPSIQAGTARVNDVDVAIHDLPDGPAGIDGLLGMSFLKHFLVTLDTTQGQLHLKRRS